MTNIWYKTFEVFVDFQLVAEVLPTHVWTNGFLKHFHTQMKQKQ